MDSPQLILFLVVALLILLWRSFLPSYFSEKGKNIATKEDIAAVTDEIERVRSDYARRLTEFQHQNTLLIEGLRSQHQLRMAAVDKRLETHQAAYTHWRILINKVFSDDIGNFANECQAWWDRNCLYLSAEAREAFHQAYFAAANHNEMVRNRFPAQGISDNMEIIKRAGPLIVSGASLPSLGELESSDVGKAPAA